MKYQDFFFSLKYHIFTVRSEDLFLSFTYEDIGVAVFTNMISQSQEGFSLRRAGVSFQIPLPKCFFFKCAFAVIEFFSSL